MRSFSPTDRRPIDTARHVGLDGRDVIVVQTKGSRLGMYLLGQAYFSKVLVERRFKPRSVRSAAVCTATDAARTRSRRRAWGGGRSGAPRRTVRDRASASRALAFRSGNRTALPGRSDGTSRRRHGRDRWIRPRCSRSRERWSDREGAGAAGARAVVTSTTNQVERRLQIFYTLGEPPYMLPFASFDPWPGTPIPQQNA